jgi:hypothetical protein
VRRLLENGAARAGRARALLGHRAVVPVATAAVVLAALVQALLVPPFHTGDETAHLDYAAQVWAGHLPVFEEGVTLAPEVGSVPPVQWVAQHPPLYYLLLAPLVGTLVEHGHLVGALYAARAVNVALAGLLVVVVAWAGRRAFPGTAATGGTAIAPVAAVVVGATAWVARVGGSAYNDVLAAVLTTWLFGVAASAVRSGLTWRRTVLLVVIPALCLGVRLHTMVMVAVMVAAVLVGVLLQDYSDASRRGDRARAVVLALGVPGAVAATTGWFWLRNLRLTGSVTGGHPDWAAENLDRVVRPVLDVLLDGGVWVRLLAVFGYGAVPDAVGVVLLLAVPAALALLGVLRRIRRGYGSGRGVVPDLPGVLIAASGAGVVVVTLAMQAMYTAGGGSPHPRYLLLVVAPLALLVARGLTELGVHSHRVMAVGLAAWCAVPLVDQAAWIAVSAPRYAGTWPDGPLTVGGVWIAWSGAALCVALAVVLLSTVRRPSPQPAVRAA